MEVIMKNSLPNETSENETKTESYAY